MGTTHGHHSRLTVMTAAVAQNLDDEPQDEPQDDPAEAPMSEAAFAVIERAHQLCGHPAARELPAEDCLIAHATKIMRAQIRAGKLLREMKERGDSDLGVSKTCLVELVDDETDEVVTDWAQIAADAWRSRGWAQAAQEYRAKRVRQ
jgi:hypothetical protein